MRYRDHALACTLVLAIAGPTASVAGPQSQSSETVPTGNAAPVPRLNESSPPPVEEIEERAMRKPVRRPPPRARATGQVADPAAVVQRGRWAELDTDRDGRVSRAEGDVDADFRANFEMLDADRDGFVTEDEYRARDAEREPPRRDRR